MGTLTALKAPEGKKLNGDDFRRIANAALAQCDVAKCLITVIRKPGLEADKQIAEVSAAGSLEDVIVGAIALLNTAQQLTVAQGGDEEDKARVVALGAMAGILSLMIGVEAPDDVTGAPKGATIN